jgi:hypothetical protein
MLGPQQLQKLPLRLGLRHDPVADVRAVETRHEVAGADQVEPLRDLLPGGPGGSRRQGDAGNVRPSLVQRGQREVVGPEVVPPLGHAVRLVNGEQRDGAAIEQAQRRLHPQSLRSQIEEVKLASHERRLHLQARAGILR